MFTAPGTYYATYSLPWPYYFTVSGIDSHVDGSGTTPLFSLQSRQSLTRSAGMYRTANIGDNVWHDLNANGVQDGGEPGLGGVTVTVHRSDSSVAGTTTTDSSGGYYFLQLTPGSYYIQFTPPPGFVFSTPASGTTSVFTLFSEQSRMDLDAGLYQLATVGGNMWEDMDVDGIQDAGEPVSGALCMQATLNPPGTTIPIGGGAYTFTNLLPGTYSISFLCAIPGGMGFSPSNVGADDNIDSDGISTPTFTLTSGEVDMSWDIGWYDGPVVFASPAWQDTNWNGIVDAGESLFPGISGSTAALYTAGGSYVKNLDYGMMEYAVPGTYYIQYTVPSPYAFHGIAGADNNVDATGRTVTFFVGSRGSFSSVAAAVVLD